MFYLAVLCNTEKIEDGFIGHVRAMGSGFGASCDKKIPLIRMVLCKT